MSDRDPAATDVEVSAQEFSDYDGPVIPPGGEFDLSQLLTAESLRALAAVIVAVMVLRAPSQSPNSLGTLFGIILGAWAVGGIFDMVGSKPGVWNLVRVVLLAGAAAALLFLPDYTIEDLGRVIGAVLIGTGLVMTYRTLRGLESGNRVEPLTGSVVYTVLGGALVAAPSAIIGLSILLLSIYWFTAGLLALITNVRLDDRQIEPSNTWEEFLRWVQTQPNTADDRTQLYGKVFFEGEEAPRRLSRFFTLMGFATAIATWGIIADSTAVVIGAMLVAPLMTPLMGTALSAAMGWPRRAVMSIGVATAGVLFAIALSVLFGWIYGPEISATANTQIASRIGPTLVDLAIAIAAGGAGAFALSRPDVSDSLPGVAVAIALVPPLAVVGLMLSQANLAAAAGAMLLFLTNLVAIVLVGGMVFVLTGVVPILQLSQNSRYVKTSLGMFGIMAIIIVAILGTTTESFRRQTAGVTAVEEIVAGWLGDSDLDVTSADYQGGEFRVVVSGSDEPPPVEELAAGIEAEFGTEVPLSVTWVPIETYEYVPGD
jgi:uncharacterized hydrophobic protein (TIGR00271 family)